MTLSDLERLDARRPFFGGYRMCVRSVWRRTTKFGMVTRGMIIGVSRQREAPSQRGGAPVFHFFVNFLPTLIQFGLKRPNLARLHVERGVLLRVMHDPYPQCPQFWDSCVRPHAMTHKKQVLHSDHSTPRTRNH